MAVSEPTASNTISTLAEDPPFLKFPPFPEPPPGVTIMSFKDFKPRGIQLFSEPGKGANGAKDDEDDELDALGIPTVELRVKHATDECKSNTRKKRKKKKAAVAEAGPVKRLLWYEEWEEGEDLRVTRLRYDARIPPVDRFYQSAYDFRTGRPWPPIASGLNNLWDHFRLFTGLLVNPSVYRKAQAGTKKDTRAESPDFDSDYDDDSDTNFENTATGDSRPAKRQRSGETLHFDGDDDEGDPHKTDEEVRDEKIAVFLSDPEKAIRIFLSSYMRERGLIWTDRNLTYMPRLVSFFLAFVIRNRVLPEPTYQRGLKRALEQIEWAKKELPLTYKVGQSIPDDTFNEACRECFGRKGGINWSVVNGTAEQNDATITVANLSDGVTTNIALPSDVQMQVKDAIEDNVDMKVSIDTSSTVMSPTTEGSSDNGWGAGWSNGWDDEGSANTWAQSGTWGNDTQDGNWQGATGGADNNWGGGSDSWNYELASLLSLLGPSAFPLTHTTGIIECSTRRVTAIHFPPTHPKGVPTPSQIHVTGREGTAREAQDWTPSAEGVEAELDTRFAKVILEPWGREEGDIIGPEIWAGSRGAVVDPHNPSKVPTTPTCKPHDPLKDSITLLVQPSFAETLELVPGLGLGAMWIEIARQKSGTEADGAAEVEVESDPARRFWYHEDVTGIFPSFYTPQDKEY